MKTVFRLIAANAFLVAGLMMATSTTVSSQTRERNGRSAVGTRTAVSSSNATNGNVSAPSRRSNATSTSNGNTINKDAATVSGRRNFINSSNAAASGNISRPTTNNSGNSSANHWPSENKPIVNSNRNYGSSTSRPADNKNIVTNPSDLRKGENARPGTMNKGYTIAPSSRGSIVTRPSSWSKPVAPPTRTNRPADFIISRPTAKKGYRPLASAPRITGIFGLTFGSTYYNSLDYLFSKGYEIDGYSGNTVYLRNVNELNFFWPDAIMHYSSRGYLESAEMHYSTRYSDNTRYTRIYTDLCRIYGVPVSHNRTGNKIETYWYGSDSRGYIYLTYYYTAGRYYTTLVYAY